MQYSYCVLSTSLLQFADFYTAVLSFFVTLITLANLSPRFKSFLHLMGAIAIALITQNDRTSLWTFVVPAGLATLLLFTCWVSAFVVILLVNALPNQYDFHYNCLVSVRSAAVVPATHRASAGSSPSVRHCCSPSPDWSSMRFLRHRRTTLLRTGKQEQIKWPLDD
mgnify:CR=1 FL=1